MAETTSPEGGVVSTYQELPTWFEQLSGLASANVGTALGQLGSLPQNWYSGPLAAGPTTLQQSAFGAAQNPYNWLQGLQLANQTATQGAQQLQNAQTAVGNIASQLPQALSKFGTAGSIYDAAGAYQSPYASSISNIASQLPTAQTRFNTAEQMMRSAAAGLPGAQQALTDAGGTLRQAVGRFSTAGQYNPLEMQRHLTPYIGGVSDEIARRGMQNLTEAMLPAVNQSFTGAGQFGGTRNAEFANRAIRDTQREIAGAQANAMNQAYGQAAQDYLGWSGQGLNAAQGLAGVGAQQAGLGATTANVLGQQANIGSQMGQLGATGANTAGNLYGAQAGQYSNLMGSLGQLGGQQALLGQMQGALPADIYGAQAGQYGQLSGQYGSLSNLLGSLGQTGSQLGWQDIGQQMQLGEAQRQIEQTGLDKSYQDWLMQLQTPYSLLGGLTQSIGTLGQPYKTQTQTQIPTGSMTSPSGLESLMYLLGGMGQGYNTSGG